MKRALAEAERGRGFVEPNPMVGAVLVRDGVLIGVGHHARFGGPHAEVAALRDSGGDAQGATAYVTLEPCCHFGKTPPCADALIASGVARVVVAMVDPFPKVAGGGLAKLRASGIECVSGVEEAAARELNAPYRKRLATGMPFVIAKWAMSLDGKTAAASGDSKWISNERSRGAVHELRGRMDAIIAGIGTVLADDPRLTPRPAGPRTPWRVVLDPAGRLPESSRLARTARDVPVLAVVNDRASAERERVLRGWGVEVLRFSGSERIPVEPLLRELGSRGQTNVLVEGGGRTLGTFLESGQTDAVEVFVAPWIVSGPGRFTPALGAGAEMMSQALRLARLSYSELDGDLRIRGRLPQSWDQGSA